VAVVTSVCIKTGLGGHVPKLDGTVVKGGEELGVADSGQSVKGVGVSTTASVDVVVPKGPQTFPLAGVPLFDGGLRIFESSRIKVCLFFRFSQKQVLSPSFSLFNTPTSPYTPKISILVRIVI